MYNACGLKSASHGAIMIMSPNTDGQIEAVADTRDVVSNTYVFTKAQYAEWITDPTDAADLSSLASDKVD